MREHKKINRNDKIGYLIFFAFWGIVIIFGIYCVYDDITNPQDAVSHQIIQDECMLECLNIHCHNCCSLVFYSCRYYVEDKFIFNELKRECFNMCHPS